MSVISICVLSQFLLCGYVHSYTYDDAKRLTDMLFDLSRYRANIKPVGNQSNTVQVDVSYLHVSVTEVNVQEGYVAALAEFELTWTDEHLVWNVSEFNGIENIPLQTNTFWTPLITTADVVNDLNNGKTRTNAWVSQSGIVSMLQTEIVKCKCTVEHDTYPVDIHSCYFTIISEKYSVNDIEFSSSFSSIDIGLGELNNQWKGNNATVRDRPYHRGSHLFRIFHISFTLSRRFMFSECQPYIYMTGLMVLNMLTPFVPPDSGERLSLCITIYLAFVLWSESVSNEMQYNTTGLSLGMTFLLVYVFINTMTVGWGVLITSLSRRTTAVPLWLVRIVKRKGTFVATPDEVNAKKEYDNESQVSMESITNGQEKSVSSSEEITWLDATRILDKIFFYCFVLFYILLAIISMIMFFSGRYQFGF